MTRDDAVKLIIEEYDKTEDFHSDMEGYALLKEKLDGLWDDIKRDYPGKMLADSAARMGAMALKFLNGTEYVLELIDGTAYLNGMTTAHEGYARILYVADELWEEVKKNCGETDSAEEMVIVTAAFLMRCYK